MDGDRLACCRREYDILLVDLVCMRDGRTQNKLLYELSSSLCHMMRCLICTDPLSKSTVSGHPENAVMREPDRWLIE